MRLSSSYLVIVMISWEVGPEVGAWQFHQSYSSSAISGLCRPVKRRQPMAYIVWSICMDLVHFEVLAVFGPYFVTKMIY